MTYGKEKLPLVKNRSAKYSLRSLVKWWGDKHVDDVTAANCRAYAAANTQSVARSNLEMLSTAIYHWHREYGPLDRVPKVIKPPPNEARDRWLTRSEAAQLAWQSRRTEHLKRIVLIGLHTGSRFGVIRNLQWSWIDLKAGVMKRRAPGATETRNKRTPEIRVPRKLLHFLRRWHAADAGCSKHVVHYNGAPLKRDPHTAWATVCRRAGVEGASLHTMRHTLATWMMQRRVSPFEAAGYLGMSVKVLTERYAKHHPDWQRDASGI